MLRHLVYEVLDVGTVILLQYLFFVRHRQVHDALHLGATARTRIDADAHHLLLLNNPGQLIYSPLPLYFVVLYCLFL